MARYLGTLLMTVPPRGPNMGQQRRRDVGPDVYRHQLGQRRLVRIPSVCSALRRLGLLASHHIQELRTQLPLRGRPLRLLGQ